MSEDCSSHLDCSPLGEISYNTLQREQLNVPATISVSNLPKGLTQSGIQNLFLAVGLPQSIIYRPNKQSAIIQFKTRNEAELAIKDLHKTPPYFLNVTFKKTETKASGQHQINNIHNQNLSENEKFKPIYIDTLDAKRSDEENIENDDEEKNHKETKEVEVLTNFKLKFLNYDPSVRMRQRKLDFKTKTRCISFGRGYYYNEDVQTVVEDLQPYSFSPSECKDDFEEDELCVNCKSPTVKNCKNCSQSICSQECASILDHFNYCQNIMSDSNQKNHSSCPNENNQYDFLLDCDYKLESGCSVVITFYSSINSVFVRIIEEPFEELYCKLCNDVALSGITGKKFQPTPKSTKMCAAKYYEDNVFYRAQIKNIFWDEKKVEVAFVDFGNRQITNFEDLRCLPEFLKEVCPLAFEVNLKDSAQTSSPEAVVYLNKLTAEEIPLIIKFDDLTNGVLLMEKDSNESVNKKISDYSQPSWKNDESAFSKLGKVYFAESQKFQTLKVGKKYSLTISHFDEKEFLECGVFWTNFTDSDEFVHVQTEMKQKITEYCEFLKNDCYLPRVKELCLAKEKGQWHRCLNLKTHKTRCFLFFVDDGHSSIIRTSEIRKMIGDFIEVPSQSICCMLSGDVDLKEKKEIQSKVVKFFKESTGKTVNNVFINEFLDDAYRVTVPEINIILQNNELK